MYPNDTQRYAAALPSYPPLNTSLPDKGPGSRFASVFWVTPDCIWIYGGQAIGTSSIPYPYYSDLWKLQYKPYVQWTWVGGSTAYNSTPVFSTKGRVASILLPTGMR
jgi:hypothetical protein